MATTKKTVIKVRKDVEGLGRNLEQLGRKLLGDVTQTTLEAAEKALAAAHEQVHKLRVQLEKPTR